jgi:site-specific recombinase XerD
MDLNEIKQLRTVTEARAIVDLRKGRLTGPRTWMVVDAALSTGLRVSELAAIKIQDIDFKRGFIKVQRVKKKKKTVDSLAIGQDLIKHLKEYLDGRTTGKLFIGERGDLTRYGLQQIWESAIKHAGLPKELSIHSARHSIAVHLLKKTGNLRQVQKQLGHASPATTANMYADISFEDMQNGVNGLYQ